MVMETPEELSKLELNNPIAMNRNRDLFRVLFSLLTPNYVLRT